MPALAGPVLPTRYRGDGGLALAGEGVTDTPMLTDPRFPTRDTATHTTVEAILSTIIRMSIHELLHKHVVAGVNYLWEEVSDMPFGMGPAGWAMCTATPMLVFPIPPGVGGVAGEAGGAAEAVGSTGAGMHHTTMPGGKS